MVCETFRGFPSYATRRFFFLIMNYTLKQLQERVNKLVEQQGEDAHCAAWIYTKEDCHLRDKDGEFDYDNTVEDPVTLECIFDDVGNIDYIYQVIQECVDECVEERLNEAAAIS